MSVKHRNVTGSQGFFPVVIKGSGASLLQLKRKS